MIQSQQLNDEVYRMEFASIKIREPDEAEAITLKLHIPAYLQGFLMDIDRMNRMYKMPEVDRLSPEAILTRLQQFKSILEEECKEIDELPAPTEMREGTGLKGLIDFADLLGDIIVYCASEAKRWNIPIDRVLNIIMQSNFSKLDSNGQPIYDERMKLMKGPNYWKPEPKIAQLLIEWNQKG